MADAINSGARHAGVEGSGPKFSRSAAPSLLDCSIATGLFFAGLILYLTTLAPSVVTLFDDSLEFQLVTFQLGIAHPTGYPLYTILGKLFTFLPVGNIAYRVNLMSAVFGAATVALVYLLTLRLAMPRSGRSGGSGVSVGAIRFGGLVGAGLFAVGPVFWQQATIAEVYTLNAFFVATILLLATSLPGGQHEQRRVQWLAFWVGLSLTHHRTMFLLLPALALYLIICHRSSILNRRNLMMCLVFGLLPLLFYLYLPLRGHIGSLDGTYQNTWAGFWQQVSAGGYGLFIFDNPFGQERTFAFYRDLLDSQFYTAVPGFIGLFYLLWVRRRDVLALTGVAFLTYTGFNLFYNVSDIEVFFIPVFLLWAVWSGVGAAFLGQIAAGGKITAGDSPNRSPEGAQQQFDPQPPTARRSVRAGRLALTGLLFIIFAFIIGKLFWTTRPVVTAGHSWQVHDYGLDMLQQPFPAPEKPVVVGILGEMTLLRYFQQTENLRPDLETVAADLEADRLAAVEKLLAEGKSVYLTRELPGAPERWSLSAAGPLIRVNPESVPAPPQAAVAADRAVTPEIGLVGYNVSRPPHTGSGPAPVRLTLFWQVLAAPAADLKVSARLIAPGGEPAAVVDAAPVYFAYPTTAWRPGEIVSDVYDLVLPVDLPPGQYTPLLIWYDPAQNAAEVGRIELDPVMPAE